MTASVMRFGTTTRGLISAGPGHDVYVFELENFFWVYKGKHHGEYFMHADVQGTEHIPQEWYAALDCAWCAPNGFCEFEDPFETLEAVV